MAKESKAREAPVSTIESPVTSELMKNLASVNVADLSSLDSLMVRRTPGYRGLGDASDLMRRAILWRSRLTGALTDMETRMREAAMAARANCEVPKVYHRHAEELHALHSAASDIQIEIDDVSTLIIAEMRREFPVLREVGSFSLYFDIAGKVGYVAERVETEELLDKLLGPETSEDDSDFGYLPPDIRDFMDTAARVLGPGAFGFPGVEEDLDLNEFASVLQLALQDAVGDTGSVRVTMHRLGPDGFRERTQSLEDFLSEMFDTGDDRR